MPVRIQRKRTKGWKMPPNAVYVGRPTKWGNPFIVRQNPGDLDYEDYRRNVDLWQAWPCPSREIAVRAYREMKAPCLQKADVKELRGKDLACWCPLDQPCHADVLLEIANGTEPSRAGTHATVVPGNQGSDTKGEKGE